jgi:hypothetical protein
LNPGCADPSDGRSRVGSGEEEEMEANSKITKHAADDGAGNGPANRPGTGGAGQRARRVRSREVEMRDCYRVAGRWFLDLVPDGLERLRIQGVRVSICHGNLYHPLCGFHGHAWVELDRPRRIRFPDGTRRTVRVVTAIDRAHGDDVELPAKQYRETRRVQDVRRYTPEEAGRCMYESHHFGPWEMEFPDVGHVEDPRTARAVAE